MMIHKTQTDNTITLALSGRLDSFNQSDLARELETVFETRITGLVFDFSALEYISSAGLRVLFSAKKKARDLGATMKIIGASERVKEIFQIVGFALDN
jgi:anti-sigma B factor antagonist